MTPATKSVLARAVGLTSPAAMDTVVRANLSWRSRTCISILIRGIPASIRETRRGVSCDQQENQDHERKTGPSFHPAQHSPVFR